jgi:hypothetical protein
VTETKPQNVILMEINEITWDLIDPLIEQGKLPTFAKLKREGAWGAPMSVDLPPQLDPWITWTTVYSGRPQADHNVFFLQQPPDTIKAKTDLGVSARARRERWHLRQPVLLAAGEDERLSRARHVLNR